MVTIRILNAERVRFLVRLELKGFIAFVNLLLIYINKKLKRT